MRDLFKPISPRLDGGAHGFSILGILLIFIVLAFILTGCITTKQQLCPSGNMVYYIFTPFGPMPVMIEKDFFNEKNKDEKWITEEEFDKIMEQSITPDENEGVFTPQESNKSI